MLNKKMEDGKMKATGIVRKLDDLGRIVIPKELRKKFNFVEKETQVDISRDGEYIILSSKEKVGLSRCLDELGRVVIPIELRRSLNLEDRDSLEIFTEEEDIYLKKYSVGCMQCGEINSVITTGKVAICRKCLKEMFDYVRSNTDILH
jgi:transcriptional pleiotropic regulator of transition state genes